MSKKPLKINLTLPAGLAGGVGVYYLLNYLWEHLSPSLWITTPVVLGLCGGGCAISVRQGTDNERANKRLVGVVGHPRSLAVAVKRICSRLLAAPLLGDHHAVCYWLALLSGLSGWGAPVNRCFSWTTPHLPFWTGASPVLSSAAPRQPILVPIWQRTSVVSFATIRGVSGLHGCPKTSISR